MILTIDVPDELVKALFDILGKARVLVPPEANYAAAEVLSLPVEELQVPRDKFSKGVITMMFGVLRNANIHTIEQLCRESEWRLRKLRCCGKTVLDAIRAGLAQRGLRLGMSDNDIVLFREGRFKIPGS